jgi:thioredoxin reductase (NADPH)
MEYTRCLIIGSGPAGYTAGIYTGRANLNPVLYCGVLPGGQLTQTTVVENFPGYPDGVDADEQMGELEKQCRRFGCDVRTGVVTEVDFSKKPYRVKTDHGDELEAETIIVATGASAKYLGLPDEKKYNGQGVSACATCDGFFYRKKTVAVVGGGDTACEEATYLAGLAAKVYMIVRKPFMRASEIMKKRVEDNPKIEVLYETNTLGLYGENGVEGAHLVYRKGQPDERKYDLPIDGFFLAIGHKPNTEVFKGQLDMDEVGYIKTVPGTPRTNVEGVFAAGDCADSVYRQAVVAAGTGCMAALEADRYLNKIGK